MFNYFTYIEYPSDTYRNRSTYKEKYSCKNALNRDKILEISEEYWQKKLQKNLIRVNIGLFYEKKKDI